MLEAAVDRAKHSLYPPGVEQMLKSPGSRYALAAAQVVAGRPGQIGNPLLIQGPRGSGKTQLLHHFHRELRKRHPSSRVLPLPAEAFFDPQGGLMKEWKQAVINAPPCNAWAVLVDGVEVLNEHPDGFEYLLRFMACCIQAGGQIVLTCCADDLIKTELASRLRLNFIRTLCVGLGERQEKSKTDPSGVAVA